VDLATINGVDLEKGVGGGGIAVALVEAPSSDLSLTFNGGWELEAPAGQRIAVLRGCGLRDYKPVLGSTLPMLERGLDLLAVQDNAVLQTHDATNDHLIWWLGPDGLVLEWAAGYGQRVTMSVTATVLDKDGNVIPQPAARPVAVHDSFRHFRRSELEIDLADAFREIWMALENLLDDIHPYTQGTEGDWLTSALGSADATVPLPVTPRSRESRVEAAMAAWYGTYRSRLFHAKTSRGRLGPMVPEVRDELSRTRAQIRNYYLELLRRGYNLRRGGGGMSYYAFQMMMTGMESTGLHLHAVGSDPAEPPYGMGAIVSSHEDQPWSRVFQARRLPVGAEPLRRLVLTGERDSKDFITSDWDVEITLEHVAELRARMRIYQDDNVGRRTTT
jgi:hypothetical protein